QVEVSSLISPSMFSRLFLFLLYLGLAAASANAQGEYRLKKVLVADTADNVLALPSDAGGASPVYVQGVPALAGLGLEPKISPMIGKIITKDLLNEVATAIGKHARENDRLLIRVTPPGQNISDGVIRIAVAIGRYNELQVQGN